MSTRFAGSAARQRSIDEDMVLHNDEQYALGDGSESLLQFEDDLPGECRLLMRLAASSKYKHQRNSLNNHSQDVRCAAAAAVIGITLALTGVSLVWFADLTTTQMDQLQKVQAAQDAWDRRFSARWEQTEVLILDVTT